MPGLCLTLYGSLAFAQNGLEKIIVETYYVSNAADAAKADADIDQYNADNGTSLQHGALPAGSVTYRFYADMLPGFKLLSIYADETKGQPLLFKTTTSFYNHPLGTESPVPGTNKIAIKNNLLALDSYYSLGAVATGQYGILKTEDPDGSGMNAIDITVANNPSGVLLNDDPAMGVPLTTQDGMYHVDAPPQNPTFAGFGNVSHSALADGSMISNSFILNDGSYFTTVGAVGPVYETNKVLIAQITTNGTLTYELNLLIANLSTGEGQFYASQPTDTDLTAPGIKGTLPGVNTSRK